MEKVIDNKFITIEKKPKTVRTIFILNLFKVFLSFGFYYAFAYTDFKIDGVDPTKILYTALTYMALFGAIVTSIIKKSIWGVRIFVILDFLVSVPVVAVIGFIISIVSFTMTFTKTAKQYFASK